MLEHMVSVYCKKLEAAGQFNSSCLVGIDEARSNAVLENLKIAGRGKEDIIYSAIQLCPYNVNAFQAAYDTMDITAVLCFKEILDCFKMTDNFCEWVKYNRREITDNTRYFYERSKKLISTISFLKGLPETEISQDLLSGKFQLDLATYCKLGGKIKNNASVKNIIRTEFGIPDGEELGKCTITLDNRLSQLHLSEKSVAFYLEMGFDVFGKLSKSFGKEISSFWDADSLIRTAWKKEVTKDRRKELLKEKDELQKKLEDFESTRVYLSFIVFPPLCTYFFCIKNTIFDLVGMFLGFLGLTVFLLLDIFSIALIIGLPKHMDKMDELKTKIQDLDRQLKQLE